MTDFITIKLQVRGLKIPVPANLAVPFDYTSKQMADLGEGEMRMPPTRPTQNAGLPSRSTIIWGDYNPP